MVTTQIGKKTRGLFIFAHNLPYCFLWMTNLVICFFMTDSICLIFGVGPIFNILFFLTNWCSFPCFKQLEALCARCDSISECAKFVCVIDFHQYWALAVMRNKSNDCSILVLIHSYVGTMYHFDFILLVAYSSNFYFCMVESLVWSFDFAFRWKYLRISHKYISIY